MTDALEAQLLRADAEHYRSLADNLSALPRGAKNALEYAADWLDSAAADIEKADREAVVQ